VGCPGVFFCLADKHTYYPVVWGVLINRQNTQYKIKRNSTRFKWTLFVRQSSQKQAVCAESRYQKQIEDAGIDDKGKRKYQTMKYNYGAFRYPGQGMRALLNILHLRHLFEFILSLATGRYLDLIACRYPLLISKIWKELRGLFRIQWLLKLFFSFHKLSFKLYYVQHRVLKIAIKEMI